MIPHAAPIAPASEPEVEQPGLSKLREAVENAPTQALPRGALLQNALAGLSSAINDVPDGLASGILAGVNPMYGLYAAMTGPVVGGLLASSQLMVITTTSASALAVRQTLAGLPAESRENALIVMVLLIGAFQVLLGLLRLGRLTRFVSYSVMTGFLAGIAVLTVLSQLPTVTGYAAQGASTIAKTINLLANLGQVDWMTLALAAFTLALTLLLPRTFLGRFGTLAAIVIPSLITALFRLEGVETVRDVGQIRPGLPALYWPSFSGITPGMVTGAMAVAAIILIQGAGVSQSVPNPDGSRGRTSRDFIAQGAANLASGLFHGIPVGGSLGATALIVITGARTRWAVVFAGLWVALIVLVFPGLVSYVIMPALGALLIRASASTIRLDDLDSIWDTGWPSRLALAATFLATLFLSITVAVGIGVVLSALLYLYQSSSDISLVELVRQPDGRIVERKRPEALPPDQVMVLDVYGPLFYGGAQTLERMLPSPQGSDNPVVILRLRGRTSVGATLVEVLANYVDRLEAAGGRLYLTGISEEAHDQIVRTGKLGLSEPVRLYEATPTRGESTAAAYKDAQGWLVRQNSPPPTDGAGPRSNRPAPPA